jgi:iron uptake system component EfeO
VVALALAGAAVAAVAAGGSAATATIKVSEREYHIGLSASSAKAGSVTFVVHNAGTIVHKLDLAGAGLKSTIKVPSIAPGATRKVTVKLAGGKLSLWCPVPGHAALGMKTSLKVSGAAAAGSSGATSQTSTDSAWG